MSSKLQHALGGRKNGDIVELPDGLRMMCQSRMEFRHFYDDIFVKHVYASHGIHVEPGGVVLDVGGNVGTFSVFAQEHWGPVRGFAFEPAPPLFRLLRQNVARYQGRVQCFNMGVSDRPGTARLTFYPQSSGMSSFHPDHEEERRNLEAVLVNEARHGVEGVSELMEHLDDYLEARLREVHFDCPLTTVSTVLDEHGLDTVDLLKIDVQKSEWQILQGIEDRHWSAIRQLVAEVHDHPPEDDDPDRRGMVERTLDFLRTQGYDVHAEQDDLYEGSDIFNLYARRSGRQPSEEAR